MQDVKMQDIVTGQVLHMSIKYKVHLIKYFLSIYNLNIFEWNLLP